LQLRKIQGNQGQGAFLIDFKGEKKVDQVIDEPVRLGHGGDLFLEAIILVKQILREIIDVDHGEWDYCLQNYNNQMNKSDIT
jgi:hypothetical protein